VGEPKDCELARPHDILCPVLAEIHSSGSVLAIATLLPVAILLAFMILSHPRKRAGLWAGVAAILVLTAAAGTYLVFQQNPSVAVSVPSAAPVTQPPPTGGPPPASCAPSGTQLQLGAKAIAFDTNCLAAPANQAFTIAFSNQDPGIQHNVHIETADPQQNPSATSLFMGDLVTGPDTTTYQVPALAAGAYFFHCDVHPLQMRGTFIVSG
jgi:plastocyanin